MFKYFGTRSAPTESVWIFKRRRKKRLPFYKMAFAKFALKTLRLAIAWPKRWLRIPYKCDKPPTRTLEIVEGNWINASLEIEVGIPIAPFDNYWKVARRDDVAGRHSRRFEVMSRVKCLTVLQKRFDSTIKEKLLSTHPKLLNCIATKTPVL